MAWDNNNNGPWGRPPANNSGGDHKGGGDKPGPDFDEILLLIQEKLKQFLPKDNREGGKGLILGGIILVLLWLSSGIYFVKADEQGVVMRFGEYVRTSSPGVNYHLPYPIESVEVPRVTAINHVEIGFRSGMTKISVNENITDAESLMLTGDENIVDIDFEVQWKISNAPDYLFNVRNPEETVKAVAESSMREVIGQTPIATVLAEGKLEVAQDTRRLIQQTLDSYKSGIDVVAVNLLKADPPAEVLDAQRDVQTALADAQTLRNQAEAYHNDIVPKARGDAQKLVLDAEAYKQEVVNRAQGEASRFLAVYNEYKQSRDVTRKRIYLETMEDILQGMNKMIIEGKSNGVTPYLPLPGLQNKSEETAK